MTSLYVGFTGTQVGMTASQKIRVVTFFGDLTLMYDYVELHHGCCIGADDDMVKIGRLFGVPVVGHPPEDVYKMGFQESDLYRQPLPFLDRNKVIVDETDLLIATPKKDREELRSGTWSTIRYANKRNKDVEIIYP